MLCYSFLDKRGDYIKKFIKWQLISDKKEVINKLVECEFDDNVIKYQEDDGSINIIDLNKRIYLRENDEFTFKVDFNNKVFNYILKKEEMAIENAPLEGELIINNDLIHLKYSLGEEEKEIIIQL